jgi:hypothetical protein
MTPRRRSGLRASGGHKNGSRVEGWIVFHRKVEGGGRKIRAVKGGSRTKTIKDDEKRKL